MDSRALKLTKHDDELYQHLKHDFPDLKIDKIDPEDLKSEAVKPVNHLFSYFFYSIVVICVLIKSHLFYMCVAEIHHLVKTKSKHVLEFCVFTK